MGQRLSIGHYQAPEQTQSQQQRLDRALRAELRQARTLSLRLQLVEAVHGERYNPEGKCPLCEGKMTAADVLRGFRDSPTDTTTQCPSCKRRFQPKLVTGGFASRAEVPFYCAS